MLTGLSGKPRLEIVATTVGETGEQAHEPLSNAYLAIFILMMISDFCVI